MRLRTAAIAAAAVTAVTVASGVLAPSASAATWESVIDGSLGSYGSLQSEWNYRYPWGSDHNGSARMYGSASDHNHVSLSGGVLTLKATRITWDEGTSTANPHPKIYYHSGAVHAKEQILVNDQFPNWEVRGDFRAPSARGTWPAFWLTGANSWPPESDILEYKGNRNNWFNTFRTSSDVSTTLAAVADPGAWHQYKAWITKVNSTQVDIHYYIDGAWKAAHRANFVGKPMWLIMNLQMEGSSGAPGPAETTYQARNLYVGRTRA
ncbi:MAG TPA: family 16 glycosylhydrolase [Actinoplanes sp.]|jgi:beta-glucanase (GH16 family)